jgi:hypothetical protein
VLATDINAVNRALMIPTTTGVPMNPVRNHIFFTSSHIGKRWIDGWASALFKRLRANEKLLI